jgi:hypothetical protein
MTLVGVFRIALAAVSFLIGVPSIFSGMYGVSEIGWYLATQPTTAITDSMIASSLLLLGLGIAWIIAGWQYWKRQYLYGVIANSVGILICVSITLIMILVRHG